MINNPAKMPGYFYGLGVLGRGVGRGGGGGGRTLPLTFRVGGGGGGGGFCVMFGSLQFWYCNNSIGYDSDTC